MNNVRATRRAPTVEDARRAQSTIQFEKKKPPPRPPPPNFSKAKSKSAWNLNQPDNTISLIEWSPPSSPQPQTKPFNAHAHFNGSVSSSFSSSTSSLASSKKSFEYESVNFNNTDWVHQVTNSTFYQKPAGDFGANNNVNKTATGPIAKPTIIRAAPPKKPLNKDKGKLKTSWSASTSREVSPLPPYFQNQPLQPLQTLNLERAANLADSPPMPNIPPPSPPKIKDETLVMPFGIALFDYNTGQQGDLQFQVNDIIYLTHKINDDWYNGRTVNDREGMFPSNFIDIQEPLADNGDNSKSNSFVTARYDFVPQVQGDLGFKAGDIINVLRIIDANWLEGESNGNRGLFPTNFVDRIPTNIK